MAIPYNLEFETLVNQLQLNIMFYGAQPFIGSFLASNDDTRYFGYTIDAFEFFVMSYIICSDPMVLKQPEFYASVGAIALLQTAGFLYRKYNDRPVKGPAGINI